MPHRNVVLANGQYYHVFNRSINKESIFFTMRDCTRAFETLYYYQFVSPPIKLSYYLSSGIEKRNEIITLLNNQSNKLIEVTSFCLMPNHFHLLLKQVAENGISKFLAQFQNSFTRYFNTFHQRDGHLFQGQFKAVRIEDDDQLLHVNRYIHLNPYTSFVVKSFDELENYRYSSLHEYLQKPLNRLTKENEIISHFSSIEQYKNFLYDQADY